MQPNAEPAVADIVHRGVLRLALFPSFFWRSAPNGEPRGVGVTIAQALADRIGVPLRCTDHGSPPGVVRALTSGAADVALLGIDPVRGMEVDFSPPLLAADFTFLVADGSAVRVISDADRAGTRIALVRHHAMDTALRGKLSQAERVYVGTPDDAFDLFRKGGADVLAGIRPGLLFYAEQLPGSCVLDDQYGRNVIALAVNKGVPGWRDHVSGFAARARTDGTVRRAIVEAGLSGVQPE